jgi:ABC-type multidrug transport system ATPase subunit
MIEVEHLSKRYGETMAVDGLDFVVRPGVVTGFLGPNGAGKSTTIRMIAGLDEPPAGRVRVNGRDYRAAPARPACARARSCLTDAASALAVGGLEKRERQGASHA